MKSKKTNENRDWYIVDAKNQILGRLATKVANVLYGKLKVNFTPNIDRGDYVVVINAKEVKVTGNKAEDKIYYRHSGYPGGIKQRTFNELMEKKPEEIITHAVKGMLPKNKIAREALTRLRVYKDQNTREKAELRELKVS